MSVLVDRPHVGVLDIVRAGDVRSVYQPIVDLDTGGTVAFEALARGPREHPLERPDLLFAAARAAGCVGELDQVCRRAAVDGAVAGGLAAPWTLFVNVEPAGIDWALAGVAESQRSMPVDLPVMVEITERNLTDDPVRLLRFVERVRAMGCGIALDDLGAERESLALLPLLRPDVIKLDLSLVQQRPTGDVAEIFSAVNAEAERSGATVLAEGIETEEHLEFARGLGARLGQGWLLGRPGPLPDTLPDALPNRLPDTVPIAWADPPIKVVPITARAPLDLDDTPFAAATARSAARAARKPLLIEISKLLESQAMRQGTSVIVVATLQHARFFTPATTRRYRGLADRVAFAAILGQDLSEHPLPGLRGGRLAPDDPLMGEWDIAVLGPHFAAALVARDLGDDGPEADRRFEYVLTHDRDVTVAVAAALIARVAPEQDAGE